MLQDYLVGGRTAKWSRRMWDGRSIQDGGSSLFPWHPYNAVAVELCPCRNTPHGFPRSLLCT